MTEPLDTPNSEAHEQEKTEDKSCDNPVENDDAIDPESSGPATTEPPCEDSPRLDSNPVLSTPNSDRDDTLHFISFNQDGGCLAVGTAAGFRICNVLPFKETFRRSLDGGGIAQIEMLYRTNLLAITGSSSKCPPNKVLIYDDHLQSIIGELSFRQKVLATRLRRDRIVVVLRDRIYVYNFSDLALLDKVHTGENPRGLIGISIDNNGVGGSSTVDRAEDVLGSQTRNGLVLACPSTKRGQVRVELYGLRRTAFVDAHESALGALALCADGSLLATASERGTVIRLFDTRVVTVGEGRARAKDGGVSSDRMRDRNIPSTSSFTPLREFRRGVDRATITCLSFSLDSCWLAAASDHGTVHIFPTQDVNASDDQSSKNSSSQLSLSSITGNAIRMLPKIVVSPTRYLMDGEQSYAQVKGIPHPRACAFVPDRDYTIAVAGEDDYGNGCILLSEFSKCPNNNRSSSDNKHVNLEDSEPRRLGYYRFFKRDGAAAMHGKPRRRAKSREWKAAAASDAEAAYISDSIVDMKMNRIHIGDEDEDDFVPIDYREKTR